MKFSHVIWDWNGTLLDDAWLCHEISRTEIVARGGDAVTFEQYRDWICHPPRHFFARCGVRLSPDEYEQFGRDFHRRYAAERNRCVLHDGARRCITGLRERGVRQTVLSAHPHDMLLDALAHYGLAEEFDRVFGHHDHSAESKVESGRRLMAEMRCDPGATVLIGDSDHDAEVAGELGIACRLVSQGLQSASRLRGLGHPVFPTLAALTLVLQGEAGMPAAAA